MQYTEFANSGRQVSRVAFGAMGLNCAFGNFDEGDLIKAVHHSMDKGVNFIDTARTYGDSEMILGKALKQWSGDMPFIASKAAPTGTCDNNGWGIPNSYSTSYPSGSVTESVDESLRQLGIDSIDLLQLHQYWSQYEGEEWY
ncbi:MAG: aldo/keto reductase, partial [Lentisphaeraceae bacterium]|nr:aldo/keto reductase [Lentisphaeraceae bacterium]